MRKILLVLLAASAWAENAGIVVYNTPNYKVSVSACEKSSADTPKVITDGPWSCTILNSACRAHAADADGNAMIKDALVEFGVNCPLSQSSDITAATQECEKMKVEDCVQHANRFFEDGDDGTARSLQDFTKDAEGGGVQ